MPIDEAKQEIQLPPYKGQFDDVSREELITSLRCTLELWDHYQLNYDALKATVEQAIADYPDNPVAKQFAEYFSTKAEAAEPDTTEQ